MAKFASPQNTSDQNLDPLILPTSTTGVGKRAVNSRTVTGGDYNVADQGVATHVDDAALVVGTDSVVAVAGFADETSPDSVNEGDVGALRMGLDRVLLVRAVGLVTSRVTHAVNVTTAATSLGTGIASDRRHIEIYNGGTATIYLGDSGVGTATGFPLGTAAYYYEESGLPLYGIATGGTVAVRVLETR